MDGISSKSFFAFVVGMSVFIVYGISKGLIYFSDTGFTFYEFEPVSCVFIVTTILFVLFYFSCKSDSALLESVSSYPLIKDFSFAIIIVFLLYTSYQQQLSINYLNNEIDSLHESIVSMEKEQASLSLGLAIKNSRNKEDTSSKSFAESVNNKSSVSQMSFVGNANSGIFHRSTCSSVQRMSPQNEIDFNSRQDAIDQGYVPCKKCKP